jgi:VanZ family protein
VSALRFLPPVVWTALIAWFSTENWSAAETGRSLLPLLHRLLPWAAPEQLEALHWLVRKTAHVVEYGVLAALWRRALDSRGPGRGWLAPFGLSVLTAALDELHQSTTLTRGASPVDVLLDSTAAGTALIVLSGDIRLVVSWLTGALLWVAAAGGTALIALDWSQGAPAGWLWWSVPAAWLVLVCWLRRARPR